ncbi:MAG: hypothetical protein LBC12_08405 [Nitrososphaerota archaeon]|jgi:hypothetical protein|nr:hypothetical protein [Nitrososphaerota archaeon]
MDSIIREIQLTQKNINTNKMFIFITIVIVFSLALYIGTLSLSTPTKQPQTSENYTVLTFVLYQSTSYTYDDVTYEFKYVPGVQTNLLQVLSKEQFTNYPAISGATYTPFNLTVTIYSANENMIVLHITPPL